MTDKQLQILNAALRLFAEEGHNAVSTSKIAKQAGVSEGLIFRHFGNKKGLLDALVAQAETRITQLLTNILFETEPLGVIRRVLELPFDVPEADYDFWRLQFLIKWQREYYNPLKMKPLTDKLAWAFEELGAQQPELEAFLLNQLLDATSIALLRGEIEDKDAYRNFLLAKYKNEIFSHKCK